MGVNIIVGCPYSKGEEKRDQIEEELYKFRVRNDSGIMI